VIQTLEFENSCFIITPMTELNKKKDKQMKNFIEKLKISEKGTKYS
jgi:hypothetical protein